MTRTKWLAGRMTVGALLILGLSAGASAAPPVVDANDMLIINHLSGSFSDSLGFDIVLPGKYQIDVRHDGGPNTFESLAVKVFSGTDTNGSSLGGINGEGAFTFTANSAGTYTALISGEKSRLHGGGTLAVSVAAVPEPETWLMLLVGTAFVAFKSLRGRQTSGSRSLGIA